MFIKPPPWLAEFIIDFRTVAAESAYALQGMFFQALNDKKKEQLASCDEPPLLRS